MYIIHAGSKVYNTTLVRYLHESQPLNNVPKNRQKPLRRKEYIGRIPLWEARSGMRKEGMKKKGKSDSERKLRQGK